MWCRRVGGGADSALGVARQAVLFPPSLEAQNLPRPARHHHKKFSTLRIGGVNIQLPKRSAEILTVLSEASDLTQNQCLAWLVQNDLLPAEDLIPIARAAAKAKGSN